MENDFKMYSNKQFAENLENLMKMFDYAPKELSNKIKEVCDVSITDKQITRYLNPNNKQRIGSVNLYAIAYLFDVSIDSLLNRCDFSEIYVGNDNIVGKYKLSANSKKKLDSINNETAIDVLNKIICNTNLIDVFVEELQNVSNQYKTILDKETRADVVYMSSAKVQREIDKLFRNMIPKK